MNYKIILTTLICLSSILGYSQTSKETPFTVKVKNSQKYGLEPTDGDFMLKVLYDENKISYTTYKDKEPSTEMEVTKITDKYVIGKRSDIYSFYDIKKEQYYYMDYFMNRYTIYGYGKDYSNIKETTVQMMKMLNDGKTQRDVISHLIKQTEYDF